YHPKGCGSGGKTAKPPSQKTFKLSNSARGVYQRVVHFKLECTLFSLTLMTIYFIIKIVILKLKILAD
ncbi:MAG: hypothetical protein WC921_04005, partial [Candidatus Paceibacterota bacterium]